MKCSLCGTDLVPGNNICPSCGALNMSFDQNVQQQPQTNTSAMPGSAVQDEELETLTPPPEAQPLASAQESVQVNTQNDSDGDGIIEQFEDLDSGEAEVVNATEDMAAPTLEVQSENLTSGAQDISSSSNVSTYDPTQEQPQDEEMNIPKEAGVNFDLPEVKEATQDTQGMEINTIETKSQTVGEESAPVKEKFSIKMLSKKSYPRKFVLILLIAIFVIGVLVGSTVFGKKVYSPGVTTKKTTNQNKIPHVADGKNNKTYAGNYVYTIPENYDFDKIDNGIVIYGGEDEFRIFIKAIKGDYEKIANAKESIRRSMANVSISVNDIKETTISDHRYVVVQGIANTNNRLYGMRSGSNEDIFYIEVVDSNNGYYYEGLDIAEDIINNVEYNTKYTQMEKATFDDVSKIIVTVADKYGNL